MRELSVTAIFQNEAPYLKEWVEFHRRIGFEFFDLFDHMSTDCPEKVLRPYLEQGIVRLTRWPFSYGDVYEWTEVQCLAYERAIHFALGKTKWLAMLDIDEFLFPVQDTLLNALKPFEEFGGVAVNWQVYGTSNIAKIPENQQMIEVLNWKAPQNQITNQHVKSIVRPERVKAMENAHSATYFDGFFQVNTKKERFEGCLSPSIEIDVLRINHYTVRDEHYLMTQKGPRLEMWWKEPLADWKAKHAALNLSEDRIIHRFLDRKSIMK